MIIIIIMNLIIRKINYNDYNNNYDYNCYGKYNNYNKKNGYRNKGYK